MPRFHTRFPTPTSASSAQGSSQAHNEVIATVVLEPVQEVELASQAVSVLATSSQPVPAACQSVVEVLPNELLAEVILQAVYSTDHSARRVVSGSFRPSNLYFPFTALFVSKHWKAVALSSPAIWARLSLFWASMESKLDLKLTRYRQLYVEQPLHIHITLTDTDTKELFKTLSLTFQHSKQLKSLTISSCQAIIDLFTLRTHFQWRPTQFDSGQPSARPSYLATIEHIEFVKDPSDSRRPPQEDATMLPLILKSHPNLKTFVTRHMPLVLLPIFRWLDDWKLRLARLEEIRLENVSVGALSLLTRCEFPNLQVVIMTFNNTIHSTTPTDDFAVFPSMRSAYFSDLPYRTALSLLKSMKTAKEFALCTRDMDAVDLFFKDTSRANEVQRLSSAGKGPEASRFVILWKLAVPVPKLWVTSVSHKAIVSGGSFDLIFVPPQEIGFDNISSRFCAGSSLFPASYA